MRQIAKFDNAEEGKEFAYYLQSQNISSHVEENGSQLEVWVTEEEKIPHAVELYQKFLHSKQHLEYSRGPIVKRQGDLEDLREKVHFEKAKLREPLPMPKRPYRAYIVRISILLCFLVYGVELVQEMQLTRAEGIFYPTFLPIEEQLLYDFPEAFTLSDELNEKYPVQSKEEIKSLPPEARAIISKIQEKPAWPGVYDWVVKSEKREAYKNATLFTNIREGEVWRLITPIFLHGNFIHILFNMLWLWLLGKMFEDNVGLVKTLLVIVISAVITNTIQYLMTGPLFMGYSGVICVMAGYIWERKKIAPWERYPVDINALVFLGIFVFGMLFLQIIAFFLQFFHIASFSLPIANSAHISGAILGVMMGRMNLLKRKI